MDSKRPKRKRRFLIYGIIALMVLAVVDQCWVWFNRRISISVPTTYITTPVSDGYPDYLGALNAKLAEGIATQDNAAPILVELAGTADDPEAWVRAVYGRWNLPVPADRAPVLEYYETWYLQHRPATVPDATTPDDASATAFLPDDDVQDKAWREFAATTQKPWTDRENPSVAAWLSSQGKALTIIERATDKPRFYMPLATDDGATSGGGRFGVLMTHWPNVGAAREAAMMLCSRAMNHLAAGDGDAFTADVLRSAKLARLVDHLPNPIFHLVGVGIDSITSRCVQAAATTRRLSGAQAERLSKELKAAGALSSPKACLCDYQRYETLDVICSSQNKGFGESFISDTGSVLLLKVDPFNFDRCLAEANDYFDRFSAALDLPTYAARTQGIYATQQGLWELAGRGMLFRATHLAQMYLVDVIPSQGRLYELHTGGAQERDLALAALSLRAYQSKTGSYPARLEDLHDDDAVDLFTDKPLVYRREGQGYTLYSVGENLTDEGGKREDKWEKGDISVTADK